MAAPPALAQAAADTPVANASGGLARSISLADAGFLDGIEFRQLSGSTTLFFPVGPREAVSAARLRLAYRQGQSLEVERHLTILLNDRVAQVERIGGAGEGEIIVEVPPGAIQNGFVKVGLEYSGANSEKICIDERASGDFLAISPGSGIETSLDATMLDTPAEVAMTMPRPRSVDVPGAAGDAARAGFVMQASALYDGEYGLVRLAGDSAEPGEWDAGWLRLDTDGSAGAGVEVTQDPGGHPALRFAGADALLGMSLLETDWLRLAGEPGARTLEVGRRDRNSEATTFAELGYATETQEVSGGSTFTIPFASADFPAGRQPESLDLLVSAARTPEGRGVTVSAFLNDTLLGNRPVDADGPVHLTFAVPRGLVGRDNQLQVVVQRQTEGGNCLFAPQGYPVQILPGSRFLLGAAPDAGEDFFLMRQLFGGGASLVLAPGADLDAALPWLSVLGGALLPDDARLATAETVAAAGQPFIYIGPDAPEGSAPPVRFDRGTVEIEATDGTTLYRGEGVGDMGLVQIVTAEGQKGIWIRPAGEAPRPGPDRPLILDRGDFAMIDAQGLVLAASSERADLARVVYPDQVSLAQLFAKYRPWIIGAAWLLITALLIRFLLGLYRSRQAGS